MKEISEWLIILVAMVLISYCAYCFVDMCPDKSQERYEMKISFVKVRFDVPKDHQLYVNDVRIGNCLYLSTKNKYKVDLYKGSVLVKSVYFIPKVGGYRGELIKL